MLVQTGSGVPSDLVLCTNLLQLSEEGFQVATEGLEVNVNVTGADGGQSPRHGLVVSSQLRVRRKKILNQGISRVENKGTTLSKPSAVATLYWLSTAQWAM